MKGDDEDGKVAPLSPSALGTAAGQKGCEGYLQGTPFLMLIIPVFRRTGLYRGFLFGFGGGGGWPNLLNKQMPSIHHLALLSS